MPKAILLDLDDTILSYESVADASWLVACRDAASEIVPVSEGELLHALKENARWFWSDPTRHKVGRMDLLASRKTIVDMALTSLGVSHPSLAERIAVRFEEERTQAIDLLPGALETVQFWKEAGIKLALLTNGASHSQRAKIDRFTLSPYFDLILIEGEFGVGKPEESVYQHALNVLNVPACDAWMIGDNAEWEVVAPQRMGIKGIWVNGKNAAWPEAFATKPYRIIRRLSDLL
ncbi:HAD family hydrolase [Ferroacidibacillus organovorans]|uniref:Phosphoglycolate phosphatase n=1 Tax=Ferroacidibacillus organovorans TaxID=1765683 RepID=A0A101XPS2_9BACL|nr:HAD family hydrolase [Ferroacidibacillus organovorans]KUO95348.1 hypothetical protein ATW55_10840 [Ferroacidibacillus organovorans]